MITKKTWWPLASAVAGGLLLAGCAVDDVAVRPEAPKAVALKNVLTDANVALKAGQADKAQALLKDAAASHPADKGPWLQLAQIKFDRASYGEAISNAQEALRRDPADKLANSIVALSGLRVSTKALVDLNRQNNLSGALRTEAQELARLARSALGEDVLVPTVAPPARLKSGPASRKATGKNLPNSRDPFGGLK